MRFLRIPVELYLDIMKTEKAIDGLAKVLPRILSYQCICFLIHAFIIPENRLISSPHHKVEARLSSPVVWPGAHFCRLLGL